MKKRLVKIASAVVVMILSFCIMTGSTLGLFTDSDEIKVTVQSANVDVSANFNPDSVKVYSMGVEQTATGANGEKLFANNGSVTFDQNGDCILDRFTPGDKVTFTLGVVNDSNIDVYYRVAWDITGELANEIVVTADGERIRNSNSAWVKWLVSEGTEKTIDLSIELPVEAIGGNNGQTASVSYLIEVVQGNVEFPDEWNGESDDSWYDETATELTIGSAEALSSFATMVAEGNTFEGKTINLGSDVDLYLLKDNGERASFPTIGTAHEPFKGTFDGNGHAIENLYQSGWDFGYEWGVYGSVGLFGGLENATVKNVNLVGFETFVEGGDVAGVAGSVEGDCTFENIVIEDCTMATYNNGCGGIVGWAGAGNYTFKDIKIDEDTVLGGLWGSFDSSIGGIMGQLDEGATASFENVEVSCRIDAYNDVTASYQYYNYRMCGMLIGRVVPSQQIEESTYPDPMTAGVTCTNVVVNYGDWMNYTYCYEKGSGSRYARVEPGYQYGGVDVSTCSDLADHITLPFDQLFAGGQYGVKGLASYEGVIVNYPA